MVLRMQKPQPKQELFMKAKTKHIGFGGARGGGKSWAVRAKAKLLCLKYPGISCIIIRRTFRELQNNHIETLVSELSCIAKYNKSDKIIRFQNGSSISFGYCNNDNDLTLYQGAQYDCIFLDEATNLREEWIKKIVLCCRGTNGLPKRIYYTMNPGGESHGYIKRLFIDKVYEEDESPEDYTFIQSLLTDNKILMETQPDYKRQLEALPPKLKQAWLEGRWDVFEGAFFEQFRTTPDAFKCNEAGITTEEALMEHRWTHVIKPFDIPKHWQIYRGYDFGYGKPFSIGWFAVSDDDNTLYQILELYGCTQTPNEGVKWSPQEQFMRVKEIEKEHPWLKGKTIHGVADPSIWDGSRGISVAEEAENCGLWFDKGINDRIAGWMQMQQRLKFNKDGYAKLYFFENCKHSIRTIPLQMYDEHKAEDLNTTLEDHACDMIRYVCMARVYTPELEEEKPTIVSDPLNQFTTERLHRAIIRR